MSPGWRFAFRLALRLGHPHPRQMLRAMSAETFIDWQRYAAIEPFDEQRADLRAGIVAATVANVMTGGRKGGKMFTPYDFMPLAEKPKPRERTAEDMLYQVRMLNKLMGGAFVDKRQPQKVD